jgi:hypothetical protein
MTGPAKREEQERAFRSAWIIWIAMLGSLVVYVLLCHVLGEQIRKGMESGFPLNLFRNALYVVVVIELGLIHFLRKFMLTLRPTESAPQSTQETESALQSPFAAKYLSAVIISLGLADSIAIYGVVLFFLGGDLQTFYTFIGISAVAMYAYRPRMDEIEQLATAMARNPGAGWSQPQGRPSPRP